jgi:hypothetical protein
MAKIDCMIVASFCFIATTDRRLKYMSAMLANRFPHSAFAHAKCSPHKISTHHFAAAVSIPSEIHSRLNV